MWVVKKLKKNLHKKLKGNKRSQNNKILLQEKENEKAERENKFVSETNLRDFKKKNTLEVDQNRKIFTKDREIWISILNHLTFKNQRLLGL